MPYVKVYMDFFFADKLQPCTFVHRKMFKSNVFKNVLRTNG